MGRASPDVPAERHASRLELLFDLVVVAGVAQIAHLLHGRPCPADLGMYALLFPAPWTAWIRFTLYTVVLPCTALPLLLAALGSRLRSATFAGLLVPIVLRQAYYEYRRSKAVPA
ncbi:low temperature requirement protein A [Streptomyces gramineus]|uniref:low temperature requirement protein A n=1 Tax=Streptomyces gramineus TaxID=910542 RepID=UPI00398ADD2A